MNKFNAAQNSNAIISISSFVNEYVKRGTLNTNLGKYKEAVEDYNKAVELNPNDAMLFYNRGTVKIELGDLEGAKEDFEKAMELSHQYQW